MEKDIFNNNNSEYSLETRYDLLYHDAFTLAYELQNSVNQLVSLVEELSNYPGHKTQILKELSIIKEDNAGLFVDFITKYEGKVL